FAAIESEVTVVGKLKDEPTTLSHRFDRRRVYCDCASAAETQNRRAYWPSVAIYRPGDPERYPLPETVPMPLASVAFGPAPLEQRLCTLAALEARWNTGAHCESAGDHTRFARKFSGDRKGLRRCERSASKQPGDRPYWPGGS